MTFGGNLYSLRIERGFKQQEVADVIGNCLRAYQHYEHGVREPQLSVLIALARFYDLTLDEMVFPKEEQK